MQIAAHVAARDLAEAQQPEHQVEQIDVPVYQEIPERRRDPAILAAEEAAAQQQQQQ